MTSRTIRNAADWTDFTTFMGNMPWPFYVAVVKGQNRTEAQNNTIHKWFGEISAHRGDTTMHEVKAECNLIYGRPILLRDNPEWGAVFEYLFKALPHDKKLKAIRLLDVPFTRKMKVKQLTEYMEQMQRDALNEGVVLTDPDASK
jgi:hypothetical protein